MPVINRIAGFADDLTAWRRHIHQNPELGLDCHETAAFVAERLREFGVDEIHEGIATSGVVAVIHGKGQGPQSWTDPAGAQVSLSQCPPARAQDVAAEGQICPCGDPQDWYNLWSQLRPPQPNRTSPNH